MYSIKSADIGRKKKNVSKRIFKTSLALVLIVFAFTMSSQSSFFQIIKPAEAAGILTSVSIVPTSNIVIPEQHMTSLSKQRQLVQ